MNPTDQSGESLCEQPVLTAQEFRALTGIGALALLLSLGAYSFSGNGAPQSAAVGSVVGEPASEQVRTVYPDETPYSLEGTSTPFEGLPEPR